MNHPDEPKTVPVGFFANLWLGLTVLLSELKWLALHAVRHFERRQMQKRLAAEYLALGRAVADRKAAETDAPDSALPPVDELAMALKQIEFLRQELAYLDAETARTRAEFVARRKKALGLDRQER